jgi:16S rRNA (adenine1518-N6/adenine1519-N6)-dimethyltransferase
VPRFLGQHFLSDPGILDRIVGAIDPDPGDVVLEIGPGTGTLTRRLASRVGWVVAIERDRRLAAALADGEPGTRAPENVTVVHGDALALDWPETLLRAVPPGQSRDGALATERGHRRFKVVGNIPYYVTSPLIERALRPPLPAVVVFLVQREVADRVAASPGGRTYGALSVGVQAVAHAERLFVVRAGAFRPPPTVDSAVLRLRPRADPAVADDERGAFRAFVVAVFGQRRKQLARALRQAAHLTAAEAVEACAAINVAPSTRPETLAVEEFARLFRHVAR